MGIIKIQGQDKTDIPFDTFQLCPCIRYTPSEYFITHSAHIVS